MTGSGRVGSRSWYTIEDLTHIKNCLRSEEEDVYFYGIKRLLDMATLTKNYAEKLNYYDRMYEDDGR